MGKSSFIRNKNNRLNFLLLFVFLFLLVTSGYLAFREYISGARYDRLVKNLSADSGVQKAPVQTISSSPEQSGPTYTTSITAISTVSTGEVYNYKIKDKSTGEGIATASVLKVVTKSASGKTRVLGIVMQVFLSDNLEENIFPAVAQTLSRMYSIDFPENKISNDKLQEYFPEGSKWSFTPFLDYEGFLEEVEADTPYTLFVKNYYGNYGEEIIKSINEGLQEEPNKPILIRGLNRD